MTMRGGSARAAPRAGIVLATLLSFAPLLSTCAGRSSGQFEKGETPATPPSQPASGPGSSAYPHGRVTKELTGEGALASWLFEPEDPRPASAPVILFLHGYRGLNPKEYGGWIEHLVQTSSSNRIATAPRRSSPTTAPRWHFRAITGSRLPDGSCGGRGGS